MYAAQKQHDKCTNKNDLSGYKGVKYPCDFHAVHLVHPCTYVYP